MAKRKRLYDIDRAKGLAIFLVVYGHLIADNFPKGNAWYAITNEMVYQFHMPFFMFLSGLTTYYAFNCVSSIGEYFSYVGKKFLRLAPAFFIFGIIILAGKIVASSFLHVDNVPTDFISELVLIAINPGASSAGSLWYIYALFEIIALFPLLLLLVRRKTAVLLPFLLVLYFFELTPYFLVNSVFEYLIFFTLGAVAISNFEYYCKILDTYRFFFWAVFILSFFTMQSDLSNQTTKLIIGICSIPALHALIRTTTVEKMNFLITWGGFSFSIYLMNTITIGIAKGMALKFISWDGTNFLFVAPILLVSGLYAPIIIKKYIFPRLPIIDKVTS